MSNSWFNDVAESPPTDGEESMFQRKLRACVDNDAVEDITLPVLSQNIGDVASTDLLTEAYHSDTREPALNLYATRIEELGGAVPVPTAEAVEETDVATEEEIDAELEELEAEVDAELEELEAEVDAELEAKREKDLKAAEGYIKTAETAEEDSNDIPEVETSEESEPEPRVTIDVETLAPNAIPIAEAAKRNRRWMVMVWADPGEGKTYFAHTAPEPIVYIDTEGKAHDLAEKFKDKEVYYLQPTDYWEAVDALDEAFNILDTYAEEGKIGTIVVDSMSIMWEWAQTDYKKKFYPNQDPADVTLRSGLGVKGGADPDWPEIKAMHNDRFRDKMVDSPYHLVWTAMRQDDYKPVFEGEGTEPVDKAGGEKNNQFKVNHIMRIERDDYGIPVARLTKCGLSKFHFRGLPFPTWETFTEAVEYLSENEEDLEHGDTFTTPSGIHLTAALGEVPIDNE